MKLLLEVILMCYLSRLVKVNPNNYRYEMMQKYGLRKRIPNFHLLNRKLYEYPQPLPSPSTVSQMLRQPYPSLYQGARTPGDIRVFRKTFNYPAISVGQKVVCDELLDCPISFMSIETKRSTPIILRGGAGYRHFTVVVKADPWEILEGNIRAYCRGAKDYT